MSLIDATYFDRQDVMIPSGSYDNRAEFITIYEPELLDNLFGYELAKEVAAYDELTSPQPIKDIVEGKEFMIDDRLYWWQGLKNTQKKSIIAYYVYYWWVRQTATTTTPNNEVKVVNENSVVATPAFKLQQTWLEVERQREILFAFMDEHLEEYPKWVSSNMGNVNAWDL